MVLQKWSKISGAKDIYRVSSAGIITTFHPRYKTPRALKPGKTRGYLTVSLLTDKFGKRSFYLHRIMAIAFIPNPENKKCVNHKDGNKSNNDLFNLEWVTYGENNSHAIRTGLKNPIHKAKGVIKYDLSGNEITRYRTTEDVPGVRSGNICRAAKNNNYTAGGFKWKFIN